ncbi:MAG: hypothetical protein GKS00_16155 [Alphaproteobacteria bacterium]|nr:hypothetical protein [Alphaproteobacteria bacterium]
MAESSTHGNGHNTQIASEAKQAGQASGGGSLSERVRAIKPASAGHGDTKASPSKVAATAHGTAAKPALGGGHTSPWSYSGENGPDRWGLLKAEYEACGKGRMQSPINLQGPAVQGEVDIEFDYKASVLQVLNNGHTFQVGYGAGSGISINGERFELLQFHFHSPSEHGRDGKRYPIEAHLVHKNAKGQLAVVGVFMESGAENIALMEMWDHMPMQAGASATHARVAINAGDLVPSGTQFYRYMGSLTTPPCSEGVNWFVSNKTVTVSRAQIEKFLQAVGGENARPLQALNNRLLSGPSLNK